MKMLINYQKKIGFFTQYNIKRSLKSIVNAIMM